MGRKTSIAYWLSAFPQYRLVIGAATYAQCAKMLGREMPRPSGRSGAVMAAGQPACQTCGSTHVKILQITFNSQPGNRFTGVDLERASVSVTHSCGDCGANFQTTSP